MPEDTPLPTSKRLLELIEAMAGQPLLMLADLVADRFILGEPKRVSREAPVLILRYRSETMTPGGGANAIANVAALGGEPLPLGVVGEDEAGYQLLDRFESLGVATDGIARRQGYRTPTKTRILGGGAHSIKQQIVRFDIEDSLELGSREEEHFQRALEGWKGRARIAVLSDYGYGCVQPRLLPDIRAALAERALVVGDSRFRLESFTTLDGGTPNQEEAEALLGRAFGEEAPEVEASGRRLLKQLGLHFLLVTRGSHGMVLFTDRYGCHLPVHGTDQVADVTGAGDTVIGAFALALAAGASELEATILANYAGGIVVMKAGTATASREELKAAVIADPQLLERCRWVSF